ncbi:MAG: Low molecular weight phosphotyrosine protein phosphatase, partial [Pseudomonadota bacterium]|nr:Low molecular weight phosphotyrosine protein phosphatase [Pseudomonadota bacterium]
MGQLNDESLLKADLILTMTKKEKEQLIRSYPRFSKKISTLSECALGKNVDMASLDGKDFKTYEQSRDQIFDYEDMK